MSLSPSDLNMGVPWDSISQPAGGEQIPEIENLRTGLARALAPAGQLAGQEETQRAMENLRQMQATMKAHNDASQRPPQATKTTTKVDPNGNRTVSIEGPAELAEYYGKAGQFYQQALGGYAKQMDEIQQQLKAQEQNIRNQPPWVQLATALSANLASQKDMPGWVRGLGQTAAQLNPQADQIRNQRLAVLGEEAQLAAKGAGLNIEGLKTITAQGDKAAIETNKKIKSFMQDVRLSSRTGEPMPRETFEAKADLWDIPQDQREALYEGHVAQSKAVVGQEERKVEQKKDLMGEASRLATERGEKLENMKAGHRLSYMREAFSMSHGKTALEFEKAKRELINGQTLALAQAKSTGVISPADSQKLQGGLSTNTYLSSISDMLSKPEWGHVSEPLFVVDRAKDGAVEGVRINPEATLPKAWQSLSRAEADNMLKHEIPRLLALLFKQGVGAQMFRSKEGAKILMDLGVSNSMRLDQMQSILKTIRETNNLSNFQPVAVTKPGVDWSKPENAAMLALDDPENAEFWSGQSRFGGKIPVARPGKPTGGKATISKDDYDEWLKTQGKK